MADFSLVTYEGLSHHLVHHYFTIMEEKICRYFHMIISASKNVYCMSMFYI